MKYNNPTVPSSYRENNIGQTLYDLVLKTKPEKIIEFGTLNGYSALAMGMALYELKKGRLVSYDLWDSYNFKHGNRALVNETIREYGLGDYIFLEKGDLMHWIPEDFDLMHVDISNTGTIIKKLKEKVRYMKGTVIFEGGTLERDKVPWMVKYNKAPIISCGVKYEIIDERFPGLSKLL